MLVAALCLLMPLTKAQAQVGDYRNDLAIGINGGYQLNSMSFVPKVPQGMLGGKTFGITGRYTCEKYFSSICAVQVEVNYAEVGWKESILSINDEPCVLKYGDHAGEVAFYSRTQRYIQVPLLAQLGWGREVNGVKAYLNMGPQFGYLLSESTSTNFDVHSYYSTTPDRVSNVIAQDTMAVENKFDYGITAGLGMEISMGKAGHVTLEARYYYGLGNTYGDSKRDYFARSNHNSIVFRASYLFDIMRTKNAKRK